MASGVKENKKLYLLFLWHMHQPVYKDASEGQFKLPWVFLHAIKDYSEMLKYYEIYPIKATFNFVPSLLDQLYEYQSYDCDDLVLNKMKKEAKKLTVKERELLIPRLFWANLANMIKPLPRYYELYEKYKGSSDLSSVFTDYELLDVEVLFLLSWTGTFLREESSVIKRLLLKGRNFSEKEKGELFGILHEKVKYIFNQIKSLKEKGKVEISLTPYFHPILPLLIDMESAKEALPDVKLPENYFSLAEDASWHIDESLKSFNKNFGETPVGMWPAEGSISSQALEFFSSKGVKWVASDEDVLAKTLNTSFSNAGNRRCIYERHFTETPDGNISIFFRDKHLSDLIGFVYSKEKSEKAGKDFISKLRVIYDSCDFSPVVPVILDGENAWEYYSNNGRDFLECLYQQIAGQDWIVTSTITETLNLEHLKDHKIDNVSAGSWIRGDFATWVGHPEKNKAWKLLFDAKKTFKDREASLSDSVKKTVSDYLRIAEGSDWFWWYGDDHHTEQLDILDGIFRSYLLESYKEMGVDIPPDVQSPVHTKKVKKYLSMPKNPITPVLDGEITDFFEYLGAGRCDLKHDMSVMHMDYSYFDELYWGIGDNFLFLMLKTDIERGRDNIKLLIEIQEHEVCRVECDLNKNDLVVHKCLGFEIKYAFKEVLEIRIPLGFFSQDVASLRFNLIENGEILEITPLYDFLDLPLSKSECKDWAV